VHFATVTAGKPLANPPPCFNYQLQAASGQRSLLAANSADRANTVFTHTVIQQMNVRTIRISGNVEC